MVYITFVFVLFKKRKNKFFLQFFENKLAYFYGTNRDYWGIIKCVILFVEKSQKNFQNFEKKGIEFATQKEKKRELEEREKEKMQNKKSKRNDVLFL